MDVSKKYSETHSRIFTEFLGTNLNIQNFLREMPTTDLVETILYELHNDISLDPELIKEYKCRLDDIPDKYKLELLLVDIEKL